MLSQASKKSHFLGSFHSRISSWVKRNMRMALPGQLYHPFGNINAFHLEPAPGQRIDKAATAPAAYIESKTARAARATLAGKTEGTLRLGQTI
jgi:hypothetical protein